MRLSPSHAVAFLLLTSVALTVKSAVTHGASTDHALVSLAKPSHPASLPPSGTTASVTALVPASQSALATTAVSSGALAALGSGGGAIAVLGAGATGLSIYAGVENSIWLYKKITMALAKPSSPPTSIEQPGRPGDDQPKGSQRLYFATFVSQPSAYNRITGPFDAILIKAPSHYEAFIKIPIAVQAYMAKNYGEFGRVGFFTNESFTVEPDDVAGVTSMYEIGSAEGISPDADIRIPISYYRVQVSAIKFCDDSRWNDYVAGDVHLLDEGKLFGADSELATIGWRRDSIADRFPLAECRSTYKEYLGAVFSRTMRTYMTSKANNYTAF